VESKDRSYPESTATMPSREKVNFRLLRAISPGPCTSTNPFSA
jgi:hypothetical protein